MSFIPDAFGSAPKVKVDPLPTRDTAADVVAEESERERKRKLLLGGGGSTALTGPGGVPSELTGTRTLY